MDKQTIKDFVKSVAEIKELKPVTDGSRPPDESTEVMYEGEWIEIDRHTNPTLGFKFVKLKENIRPCMLGCGELVANQLVEKRVCTHPQMHWRTRCANCAKFVAPDGNGFIEGAHLVQMAFNKYFNSLKGIVTREETIKYNFTTDQTYEESVTKDHIIKKYK